MRKRIILCGAAGSGKDYMRDKFVAKGFKPDVSVTTRPMREGEVNGKTYHYIDKILYSSLHDNGMLYEAVEFNGWKYGTLLKSWQESDIFIMTPSGISQIKPEERKECFIIYLDIPEPIRRERVAKRSDADSVERRIEADRKDFAGFMDYDMRITDPNF
jgi:guanylate kinase